MPRRSCAGSLRRSGTLPRERPQRASRNPMGQIARSIPLLEVGKLRFRFTPQIFPAPEDHLMQLLLREERAHLLGQLLAVPAHMPFQVVLPMLFRFAPGSPDVEGDVLLRKAAIEFLNLKASHHKNPR